MLHVALQVRKGGRAVGVGQRRDRFARLLQVAGVAVVLAMAGVLAMVGMVRVRIVLLRLRLMLVLVMLRMRRSSRRAQRERGERAGKESGAGAHSSTRTSRIIPASMW